MKSDRIVFLNEYPVLSIFNEWSKFPPLVIALILLESMLNSFFLELCIFPYQYHNLSFFRHSVSVDICWIISQAVSWFFVFWVFLRISQSFLSFLDFEVNLRIILRCKIFWSALIVIVLNLLINLGMTDTYSVKSLSFMDKFSSHLSMFFLIFLPMVFLNEYVLFINFYY
jgi:hypothetical protein